MLPVSSDLIRLLVIRLLVMLALIVACIVGLYFGIKHFIGGDEILVLAILGGMVMGVALTFLRNGLEILSRRRLLAAAHTSIPAGKPGVIALTGKLNPVGKTLQIPFLDGEFVAITYQVTETIITKYRNQTSQTSGPPKTIQHMGGLLSTPGVLQFESGSLPLCAVLIAENFPSRKTPSANFAATLRERAAAPEVILREKYRPSDGLDLIEQIGGLPGGDLVHEWYLPSLTEVVESSQCHLEVKSIPAGAEVSVVGHYDPHTDRIFPNPLIGMLEIYPGNAREACRQMLKSAGQTFLTSGLLIIFSLLISFGIATLLQVLN